MEKKEINLELGYGLLPLVDAKHGTLIESITKLREEHPDLPKIHIMDNMTLEPRHFRIEKKDYSLESNAEDVSFILNTILEYVKQNLGFPFCKSFKTGESLSLSLMNLVNTEININFMLAGYPSFWNSLYYNYDKKSNSKYCFFITEISEVSDGLYKFEIINTDVDKENRRYCFGGRFKYFLKKNDSILLQYYENSEDYIVKATVFDLKNNSITFSFDKEIKIPDPFLETKSSVGSHWI